MQASRYYYDHQQKQILPALENTINVSADHFQYQYSVTNDNQKSLLKHQTSRIFEFVQGMIIKQQESLPKECPILASEVQTLPPTRNRLNQGRYRCLIRNEKKRAESDIVYKEMVKQEQDSINNYLNQQNMFTVKKNQLFKKEGEGSPQKKGLTEKEVS